MSRQLWTSNAIAHECISGCSLFGKHKRVQCCTWRLEISCRRAACSGKLSAASALDPPFHWILFFSFFSMSPIPSNTLVMSYILRFCTCNSTVSDKSALRPKQLFWRKGVLSLPQVHQQLCLGQARHQALLLLNLRISWSKDQGSCHIDSCLHDWRVQSNLIENVQLQGLQSVSAWNRVSSKTDVIINQRT